MGWLLVPGRRTDRLAALRERVEQLLGYEGERGTHVLAASPERLSERRPKAAARSIDAVNMATGERTDGRGSVGCLAALAIIDCPEEAAATHRRIARDDTCPSLRSACSTSPPGSSASTPATGDALFCGVGSSWFENLGNMPNGALLDALDRTVAGAVGDDILTLTGHSIRA